MREKNIVIIQRQRIDTNRIFCYTEEKVSSFFGEFPLDDVWLWVPVTEDPKDRAEKDILIPIEEFEKIDKNKLTDLFMKKLQSEKQIDYYVIYADYHEMLVCG